MQLTLCLSQVGPLAAMAIRGAIGGLASGEVEKGAALGAALSTAGGAMAGMKPGMSPALAAGTKIIPKLLQLLHSTKIRLLALNLA